jgi:hypothetical protein
LNNPSSFSFDNSTTHSLSTATSDYYVSEVIPTPATMDFPSISSHSQNYQDAIHSKFSDQPPATSRSSNTHSAYQPSSISFRGSSLVATDSEPYLSNSLTSSPLCLFQPRFPHLTTFFWEDQNAYVFQLDTEKFSICRRSDNNYVNGYVH